jgi:hypothetical protein
MSTSCARLVYKHLWKGWPVQKHKPAACWSSLATHRQQLASFDASLHHQLLQLLVLLRVV